MGDTDLGQKALAVHIYLTRKTETRRMDMADYIVRGTAADNQIRVFAATTRELVEHARQAHNTSPVSTAALGRLLTGGVMMGSMMKGEKDLLTLQIQCNGPIKGLTVTADSAGNVKGYAYNPQVMLPPSDKGKLDVGKALDLGVLSVFNLLFCNFGAGSICGGVGRAYG